MAEVGRTAGSEGGQGWGAPRAKTVQWYDPAITAAAAAGSGLSGLDCRVAFCRADIVDGAGTVVATATSSCLVMPG